MAKSKIPYESLSISDKIEVKRKKIQRLFRDLPAERKQFADGLIYQFAVTTVTLERLVEEINAGDLIEDFKQGAQQLRRETPALKSYNTTIKSYLPLEKPPRPPPGENSETGRRGAYEFRHEARGSW